MTFDVLEEEGGAVGFELGGAVGYFGRGSGTNLGSSTEFRTGADSPTLRIDDLTVAGA